MILKRAMKGRLDIMGPAMGVSKELMSIPDFGSGDDDPFSKEKKLIQNFKKAILMTAGAAVQKLMMKLESEQEILMNIADMIITTFIAESALVRAIQLAEKNGEESTAFEAEMVRAHLYDAADKMMK